ncbi:hypothetical protein STEG23_015209 [Scotinomys teguina]
MEESLADLQTDQCLQLLNFSHRPAASGAAGPFSSSHNTLKSSLQQLTVCSLVHMSTVVHGVQMRVSDALKLELRAAKKEEKKEEEEEKERGRKGEKKEEGGRGGEGGKEGRRKKKEEEEEEEERKEKEMFPKQVSVVLPGILYSDEDPKSQHDLSTVTVTLRHQGEKLTHSSTQPITDGSHTLRANRNDLLEVTM